MRNNLQKLVRAEGLEPPSREAPEPKSGAFTNSATPAKDVLIKQAFEVLSTFPDRNRPSIKGSRHFSNSQ